MTTGRGITADKWVLLPQWLLQRLASSISKDGRLESDELLVNGIDQVKLLPATDALELYYTIDGGGHWTKIEGGAYTLHASSYTL